MIRELDIRNALKSQLVDINKRHANSEALILDEMGLCQGVVRADVVVVNGSLHGFEIKSAQDTLKRLPEQARIYNQVFDKVAIVAPENHLKKIENIVPGWWGLIEVVDSGESEFALKTLRRREQNPDINPYAVAQLLWRDEVIEVLAEHDLLRGFKSKPNKILWQRLADHLSKSKLCEIVRARLKTRAGWRSDGVRV